MPPSRSRIVDPAGRITTFVVDTDGDLVRKVCPELCVTEFRYDAEHRLVASVDSGGHRTSYSYDSIDRLRSVRSFLYKNSVAENLWRMDGLQMPAARGNCLWRTTVRTRTEVGRAFTESWARIATAEVANWTDDPTSRLTPPM